MSTAPYSGREPIEAGVQSYLQDPVHYFPLTERIRQQLARGLPYFTAGTVAIPAAMQGRDPLDEYRNPPSRAPDNRD